MASFPKFIEMAVELQDMIWDRAIRDDLPAAHFLSVFNDCQRVDCRNKTDPDNLGFPISKRLQVQEWFSPLELGAPFDATSGRYSWTQNSRSIYMQDSGLWTACKASRQRMMRFFQPQSTSTRVDEVTRSPTLPTTIHIGFTRGNGEQQYLAIRPSMDLLCLQMPRHMHASDSLLKARRWESMWHTLSEILRFDARQRPAGNLGTAATTTRSISTLRHVAVEFDPTWGPSLDGYYGWATAPSVCGLPKLEGLESFWFIDYQLKRKTTSGVLNPLRKVFDGRGCKFVEVAEDDSDWTRGDADEETPEGTESDHTMELEPCRTAHWWARKCPSIIDMGNRHAPYADHLLPLFAQFLLGRLDRDEEMPKFGVLACIKL